MRCSESTEPPPSKTSSEPTANSRCSITQVSAVDKESEAVAMRHDLRAQLLVSLLVLSLCSCTDKNDSPEAAAMFLEMTEAFAVLYDEVLRAKYDSGMGGEQL